jgi:hypothetical protein
MVLYDYGNFCILVLTMSNGCPNATEAIPAAPPHTICYIDSFENPKLSETNLVSKGPVRRAC